VSGFLILALVPAVLRAALLAFVTVVAVLTDDEDRRKVALVVLRLLSRSSPQGASTLQVLRAVRTLNKPV
jgi:hypothetical protein